MKAGIFPIWGHYWASDCCIIFKALEILQGEWTALMIAAFKGHAGVVVALLSKGADLEARSKVLGVVEGTTCVKPFANISLSVPCGKNGCLFIVTDQKDFSVDFLLV